MLIMEESNNSLLKATDEDKTSILIDAFDQSFEKNNLVDIFLQAGEFVIDQAIENNLLKDIPVFGVLVSGYKTVVNIKAYRLARKVFKLLYNLQDTTPKERQKFVKRYCEFNQEDTAAALLEILEKINNINTVTVVCNLIKAVIKEEITIIQFNRLIVAMQRTSYTDLIQLEKYENEYDEYGLSDALLSSGLIYQSNYDNKAEEGKSENKFQISPNGILLLKHGFKRMCNNNFRNISINTGVYWEEDENE